MTYQPHQSEDATMKPVAAHAVCRKCGGWMQPGRAIEQTFAGIADFSGGGVCTVSPGGPGKLIDCMKCIRCGWSTT